MISVECVDFMGAVRNGSGRYCSVRCRPYRGNASTSLLWSNEIDWKWFRHASNLEGSPNVRCDQSTNPTSYSDHHRAQFQRVVLCVRACEVIRKVLARLVDLIFNSITSIWVRSSHLGRRVSMYLIIRPTKFHQAIHEWQ